MADPLLTADRAIALRLTRAWPAFFQRFGRLTPVQRSAIPEILDGTSVLVTSATASGKTEAACAPLLERNLAKSSPSTILYISPTRALVNDLFERLSGPCRDLSAAIARRTGEHKTKLDGTPAILITTPESLDSLLCRGRNGNGHALANTTSVVLDEVHLLHGTPRGEQVRWLVERLRRLRGQAYRQGWSGDDGLQVVALSATVDAPEVVRDQFLPGGKSIVVPGHREIEAIAAPEGADDLVAALTTHLRTQPSDRKILVFCNARREVDNTTRALRDDLADTNVRVHAHHGSLSKRERELAEADLKSDALVIAVATSTLEIGIDVGDIDLVVLNGPPPDVPSLLQRIGRGNRRTGTTRVMTWSRAPTERLIHSAMLHAAQSGAIGGREIGPQYGVIRQQLASYIFQARQGSRTKASLERLCGTLGLEKPGEMILREMLSTSELVTAAGDDIGLGIEWRDATGNGEIHSTIESSGGTAVVDADGSGVIAKAVKYGGGTRLGIGGHKLDVTRVTDGQVEVRRGGGETRDVGDWRYVTSPMFKSASQPQAVRHHLRIAPTDWVYLRAGSQLLVFHFGGGRRQALLQLLEGLTIASVNRWLLNVGNSAERTQERLRRGLRLGSLRQEVAEQLSRLEHMLGRPKGNARLPTEVRIDEVMAWLAVDEEMAAWAQVNLVEATDPALQTALGEMSQHTS
jgi:ATP-dependent helicase Lhr and Lhr-like helicase